MEELNFLARGLSGFHWLQPNLRDSLRVLSCPLHGTEFSMPDEAKTRQYWVPTENGLSLCTCGLPSQLSWPQDREEVYAMS